MQHRNILVSACIAIALPLASHAQTAFQATLTDHAVLPAQTMIAAPHDAPAHLQTSGKFTTGKRVEKIGSVEGMSFDRPTGVALPFKGQPIQGHSGVKRMADGTFWLLTDNGAGSKANSPDFMLYLNHYKVDFKTNQFTRLNTIFCMTQTKKFPFTSSRKAVKNVI